MGYIGINTIITFSATFVALLSGSILMYPDVRTLPLAAAALLTAGVLPVVFYPSSRTLWTAIDIILRPLRAGEVDPRLVLVDPRRDRR